MSEYLEKFKFNGQRVRVVLKNDEPWFVAKDVCDVLGTRAKDIRQILNAKHIDTIMADTIGLNGRGHGGGMLIISEAGLYNLILKSRKPEAEAFQDWVTEDVLPSIRKTGAYMTDDTLDAAHNDPALMNSIIDQLIENRMRMRALEQERDNAIINCNAAITACNNALDQRDIAIRQRGLISRHREATALQRNSVLARQINTLARMKLEIEDELDALKPRAERYDQWRSNISSGLRRHYRGDDDNDDLIPILDYWM